MALTRLDLVGDGTTTVYDVDFVLGHLDESHVYVYLGTESPDNQLTYTWLNDTQIQLSTPLAVDTAFHIRRIVPRDKLFNDYTSGAILRENNLDDSYKQSLMILEEVYDGFLTLDVMFKLQSDLDMTGHKIHHLAMDDEPADDQAANVAYVKELTGALAEYWAKIAQAAAEEAVAAKDITVALSSQWREDYLGNYDYLPQPTNFPDGITNGALMYYDGVLYSQGLWIYYDYLADEFTGPWLQISGVGPQGPKGSQGIQGVPGVKGDQGETGPRGDQGQQGIQGAIGDTGAPGPKGETGATGPQGVQGVVGPEGPQGDQGQEGPQGPIGVQGIQGPQGPEGSIGNDGPPGVQGPDGPAGIQRPQGLVGPEGPDGPQGIQGPQGKQGPVGQTGATGSDGQSFQIDQIGTLAERPLYDNEPENFTFYATDYSITADTPALSDRFVGDGTEVSFTLGFTPDGQQSIGVWLAGVFQGPDNYTVSSVNDTYTLTFNTAPYANATVLVREFSVATGYGAIFIKNSNTSADWSDPVPFGRGPRGDQGPEGVQGATGVQGPQGQIGPQGTQGIQGPKGPDGNQGVAGDQGVAGPVGPQGEQGNQGPRGVQGPQGDQGIDGVQGPKGKQGAQGITGPQGATGDVGPQGAKGAAGDRGPVGIQGPEGARGPTGEQGKQGNTGQTGPQGIEGPQGAKGERGDQGAVGPTGASGKDGSDGAQGPTGNQGPDGAAGRSVEAATYDYRLTTIPEIQITSGVLHARHLFTVVIERAEDYDRQLVIPTKQISINWDETKLDDISAYYNRLYSVGTYPVDPLYQVWQSAETINSVGLIIDIPANTTGSVAINWDFIGFSSLPTGAQLGVVVLKPDMTPLTLEGVPDADPYPQFLVQLFATGTSLGVPKPTPPSDPSSVTLEI